MIGALGKLVGVILVSAGVLAMLAGPLVMAYALQEQAKNEEGSLLGDDQQRTQDNGGTALAGALASVGGVVATAVGLILVGAFAAGVNGRRQRRMRRASAELAVVRGKAQEAA